MKKCGDKMDFHKETQRIARRLHTLKWMTDVTLHPGTEKAEPDKLVLFDTAINSQNMGDSWGAGNHAVSNECVGF